MFMAVWECVSVDSGCVAWLHRSGHPLGLCRRTTSYTKSVKTLMKTVLLLVLVHRSNIGILKVPLFIVI